MATSLQGSFIKVIGGKVLGNGCGSCSSSGFLMMKHSPTIIVSSRPLEKKAFIPSIVLHFQSKQLSPNIQTLSTPGILPKQATLIPGLKSVMHTVPL